MQNVQQAACSQRACVIDACPYESQSTENLQQLDLITPAASKCDQATCLPTSRIIKFACCATFSKQGEVSTILCNPEGSRHAFCDTCFTWEWRASRQWLPFVLPSLSHHCIDGQLDVSATKGAEIWMGHMHVTLTPKRTTMCCCVVDDTQCSSNSNQQHGYLTESFDPITKSPRSLEVPEVNDRSVCMLDTTVRDCLTIWQIFCFHGRP